MVWRKKIRLGLRARGQKEQNNSRFMRKIYQGFLGRLGNFKPYQILSCQQSGKIFYFFSIDKILNSVRRFR
jgi:hypothetical protein